MPDDQELITTGDEDLFAGLKPDDGGDDKPKDALGQLDLEDQGDPDKSGADEEDKDKLPTPSPLDTVLEGMTAEQIRDLLQSHPSLKPVHQQLKDREVQAVKNTSRRTLEEEVRRSVAEEAIENQIRSMSQEEVSERLSSDPQFRSVYTTAIARAQEREKHQWEQEILQGSQLHANATIIHAYGEVIKASPLPAEIKTKLSPENFRNEDDPVRSFIGAYVDALTDYKADLKFNTELKKDLEAALQTKLADGDLDLPNLNGGRARRGTLDIMSTSSDDLISAGLAENEKKRRK
jgi:hypothetical protein